MKELIERVEEIRSFFEPKNGVAVIGASNKEGKVGNAVITNLTKGSVKTAGLGKRALVSGPKGFAGNIYPINNRAKPGDLIGGLPAYKSILDVADPISTAIIVVPSKFVMDVIRDCGKKGVKSLVVITAGFSETGSEDAKALEKEVVKIAHYNDMRIIGPNCLGIIRCPNNYNASFSDLMPPKGPISFISQSGALCTAVINYSFDERIGFANFVSIGNKADVDDADLLEYFAEDLETKVIALYIESIKNGKKFREVVDKVIEKVPIVVAKSGRTAAGAKAASSHTGSIAGSDIIYDAMFAQYGIYRARSMNELFYCAKACGYQPPAKGDRIGILTNAGGPGVMAADDIFTEGLTIAKLSKKTIDSLNKDLPPAWSHANPVDILGDALADRYELALNLMAEDSNIDAMIVILCPTAMVEPLKTAKIVVDVMKDSAKPVSCAWLGLESRMSSNYLDEHGIIEVSFPDRCVRAIKALVHRGAFLKKRNLL
ncbi:MAG: CoA-binding protein [Candidatus Helarchaeota archaeon]|nr:CoA-binding protein [Candidatus Helarchaeota archaeon]